MIFVKYVIIFSVFIISFIIGNLISKKYILRVKELRDLEGALNIIENKIKFTYEPLSEIFFQTSKMVCNNISKIFLNSSIDMKNIKAEEAWDKNLKESNTNLKQEDIENIKSFGKMLGKTDKEGQISQIELTRTFLNIQIEKARIEENKNAKLYKTLGVVMGLAFIIILI